MPNVGVLGSHGATATPLLATLLAYGRNGLAAMIDKGMELADELYELVEVSKDFTARSAPHTGVLCWRHNAVTPADLQAQLPRDTFISTTTVDGEPWLRSVAANPMANPVAVLNAARAAAQS